VPMTVEQPPPLSWVFRSGPVSVSVEPFPGHPGVLVSGVDPAEPLDDATVGALRQALDTWKVLFFQRPEPARFGRTVRVQPAVLDNSAVG